MPHTCKALILHCMDFRLGPAVKGWLEERGLLGDCDIISHAGATRDMTVPMSQIELSKKLHGISKVILMNHTDCGAYGGRAAFGSEREEVCAHADAMREAKRTLAEKFSDIDVETVLACISEDGHISFQETE